MAAKETKDVLIALRAIVPPLVAKLKDGFQVNDLTQLLAELAFNAEVQAKIKAAVDGSKSIPAEFKDLTPEQMVALAGELAPDVVGLTMDVIAALKAA